MPIAYTIVRSDRRTLSLVVDERGALTVRAPLWMSAGEIRGFVGQKQDWVLQKQAEAKARAEAARPFRWEDGECLPYLGGSLRLFFDDVPEAFERNGVLTLPRKGGAAAHARRWLARRADEALAPRVAEWARRMGLMPKRLLWSTAGKRWGSMCTNGTLRLNLALLHCPWEAVDYVIVHELAHIAHPDHSAAFHARVRRYVPNEPEIRKRMGGMTAYLTLTKGGADG